MVATIDMAALHRALTKLPGWEAIPAEALEVMATKGLAHEHVRIADTGYLLRVPKQSQFGYAAAENLHYQAACFSRVSESGHAPRLAGIIEPSQGVPLGALVVEKIEGRPPKLPEDLPAFAAAMARVHALGLPAPAERAPLEDHRDPVAGMLAEIEEQAAFLEAADLAPEALAEIEDELDWARAFSGEAAGREQPRTLVLTDTHPGNFLIEPTGKAVIVDLEKALYGSPGVDLAHATVYSSTTWDVDTYAELSLAEVAAFYGDYLAVAGEARGRAFAEALRPWLVPMRRLLFLRAITWCAMWRVEHRRARRAEGGEGESARDWSAEKTDAAVIAHVRGRVDEYLSAPILKRMRGEWLGRPGLEQLIA